MVKTQKFLFTKMHMKKSYAKWWPFCPGGEELINYLSILPIYTGLSIEQTTETTTAQCQYY